jgi:methionine-rich copper-binding protein CopC
MNDHNEWYPKRSGDGKQRWHTGARTLASVARPITLLATLLAMNLLSATSATAHRYLVENKEVKGTEIFKTTGVFFNPVVLEGKISGKRVAIECTGGSDKDEIEKEGHSKGGELTLEGCVIHEIKEGKELNLTECTVSNPVLKFKDSLITGAGESVELELQPSTGTSFGEFELSGASCGIKGKEKIESATEGKGPVCFVGITGEVEDIEQFAECTPTGSKELRLGGEKAGFNALFTMTITAGACPDMWRME